jgi:hypothetical protein
MMKSGSIESLTPDRPTARDERTNVTLELVACVSRSDRQEICRVSQGVTSAPIGMFAPIPLRLSIFYSRRADHIDVDQVGRGDNKV